MIWLNMLWFVFAVIFFALGVFHWRMASKNLSDFQVPENFLPEEVVVVNKIDKPNNYEFVDNLNRYVEDINQFTKKQNKAQAIGYWVASIIAVFSFVLVIVS